jgi:hypothetical protein
MWRNSKTTIAIASIALLFAIGVGAAPKDESPKSPIALWEYRVMDLDVIRPPNVTPESTPAELEDYKKQYLIQSNLNPEWPRNVPWESVHEFERRLVELGADGWELVLKDRNMVVFKRPKP